MNTGRCRLPHNPLLVQELSRLELVKGKKVDHPPHGSKDLADAVCGAVFNAFREGSYGGFTFSIDGVEGGLGVQDIGTDDHGSSLAGVHIIQEAPFEPTPLPTIQDQADQLQKRIQLARRRLG